MTLGLPALAVTRLTVPRRASHFHLRFDKVAVRLIEGLKRGLRADVPYGLAVMVTITAPIRVPARTAAGLEAQVRLLLEKRTGSTEHEGTIHGNRIRIRIARAGSAELPKVSVFVHNPETDSQLILEAAFTGEI